MESTDQTAVLFANEAFYAALAGGDFAAMDDLWAGGAPVTCIHPGWPLLTGRSEVMASWKAILENPQPTVIEPVNAIAVIHGDVAFALCNEILPNAGLIATNAFVREVRTWKMIHHQSGPAPLPPPETARRVSRPPDRLQ
jgi:ketosteroid isomerase-like protein